MMQLHDQLSRKCIVTLVPSLMVLSDVAVVLSYIHIDTPEKKKADFNVKRINGEEYEITVGKKK